MERCNFKNVNLVIAEPNEAIRFGLRGALMRVGFEHVADTGDFSTVRELCANGDADLLICGTRLTNGDFGGLIHHIRHYDLGHNPFINIITMIPAADEQTIRKAINAGTDDILVMPFAPGRLLERIDHMIRERKPFVVTTDYIGPNRRTGHRPGSQVIPQIEVPNPLRAMVEAAPDRDKLRSEIDSMAKMLNEQKIERHAFQIVYLADKIDRITTAVPGDDSVRPDLERLLWVSNDIGRRVAGTAYAHWDEKCRSLVGIMTRVRRANMKPTARDLLELNGLAKTFKIDIRNIEQPAARIA
ncbi:MAG: response regulator [Rhodospirillales bacterium]|nr:response regulator [Rhodospirillales bacterium]